MTSERKYTIDDVRWAMETGRPIEESPEISGIDEAMAEARATRAAVVAAEEAVSVAHNALNEAHAELTIARKVASVASCRVLRYTAAVEAVDPEMRPLVEAMVESIDNETRRRANEAGAAKGEVER